MELITVLSEGGIAANSYRLFRVVTHVPVSSAYSPDQKLEASRLTLHGAYKGEKFSPVVEDPRGVLVFLNHEFELDAGGKSRDESIRDALRALASVPGPTMNQALEDFDLTQVSFTRGISHAFWKNRPLQLRKAALYFLPLIADKWFNTDPPTMQPEEMNKFCVNWASVVGDDEEDVLDPALAVLFDMMNSSHWRPHIPADKWGLLKYFLSVPEHSEPLRRCLDNPDLVDAILKLGNPGATVLWLTILWLKHPELTPEARERLEKATRQGARDAGKGGLDKYLARVRSESKKVQEERTNYSTFSKEPRAIALQKKIDGFKKAEEQLVAIRGNR
jgi:hypothetical protein